jgi:hypothetical protein
MRRRLGLIALLTLNVALAVALFYHLWMDLPQADPTAPPVPEGQARRSPRTGVVVMRQPFTWSEIESEDYPTYISNLRDISCPESTIRDIILAEVNHLFARRRAVEVITPEEQWWRSIPDPEVARTAQKKLLALEDDRRQLLTQLLGSGWERVDPAEAGAQNVVSLNGIILGNLPAEKKFAVQEISLRAQKRILAYMDEQQKAGKPVDPAEYARLRQQTRDELAQHLNPEQLEEYLLRNSYTANRMRTELRALGLEPEEFRLLFRARDAVEQQLQVLSSSNNPEDAKRRMELERQRDQALLQVVGPERYQQYNLQQDPTFRQTQAAAQRIGIAQDAFIAFYQVNKATEAERQRIRNDRTLTPNQQADAIRQIQEDQQEALRALLGEEAYLRYQDLRIP